MRRLFTEEFRHSRFNRLSSDRIPLLGQVQQYGIHPASQLTIIAHELWADVEIVNVVAIGLFRPCSWFLCRGGNAERTFVSGSWLRNWLMMNVILSTICSDVLSKELGVPFIARWPGRIAAGRIDESSLISAVDLLTKIL